MHTYFYRSPVGYLKLITEEDYLKQICFVKRAGKNTAELSPLMKKVIKQLDEYFSGERKAFDLPLSLEGTDFQKAVWKQLQKIKYGSWKSYGEVAKEIKREKAARAVGSANNRNKIPIVIPCHRVMGTGGKMVGFAPGISYQKWLIEHEVKNR